MFRASALTLRAREFIHNVNGSPVLDNWGGGNLLDPTCVGARSSSRKGKK
jgi:hypothetical protein